MSQYYIGLMSGTSMDAVDTALVDFSNEALKIIATHRETMPEEIKDQISALCSVRDNEINLLGALDQQIGHLFADAALNLLKQQQISADKIIAIGSHGQTIRHHPNNTFPFTLQIADPNVIAEKTGITTIADFRRRDIVNGGQGAPLTPAFHAYAFRTNQKNRVILNIGGMANITLLPADLTKNVTGFDTGPGNTLIDSWIKLNLNQSHDKDGQWAKSGKINTALLAELLADPYFSLQPPKSTGREYFNLPWLQHKLKNNLAAEDVQATLTELTAQSIMLAIDQYAEFDSEILICGGGVYNKYLQERLNFHCKNHSLHSTADFGLPPEWVEAVAFAWLAKQTMTRKPANLPSVTGAKKASILGGIYLANNSNLANFF